MCFVLTYELKMAGTKRRPLTGVRSIADTVWPTAIRGMTLQAWVGPAHGAKSEIDLGSLHRRTP